MKTNLDKKFDQHFKSSFEDFEVVPSADSWKKISTELEKKPTKRPFIYWSAAASILLLMSVGIGLYIHPFAGVKSKPDVANPVLTAKNLKRALKNEMNRSNLTLKKNVLLKTTALAKEDLKLLNLLKQNLIIKLLWCLLTKLNHQKQIKNSMPSFQI